MLSDAEKNNLSRKLEESKREISKFRDELNNLNEQKESWFRKKVETSKKIVDLIRHSKTSKDKRNEFTKQVHELKQERSKFTEAVKGKISELKVLNSQRTELISKLKTKEDPREIKSQIKKMEYKIETEPMSFDKERELMKKIKELKKKFEGFSEIMKVEDKIRKLSKTIDDEKRVEREVHNKVQVVAKEGQARHEEMVGSSSTIDELKKEEKEHEAKFLEFRKLFAEKNEELKQKLPMLRDLGEKLGEHIGELKEERKKKQRSDIDSRVKEVQEKMKSGKKLTTEDIMLLQHGQEGDEEDEE
ncbi:MAG: hypothetical protein Q8O89_04060 [Nanoarchaeota archaeon]|nr:hypothetical protein [Nanoarchaeota archaeon]